MKPAIWCTVLLAVALQPLSANLEHAVSSADLRIVPRELELFDEVVVDSPLRRPRMVLRERLWFSGEGRVHRRKTFDGSGELLLDTAYRYNGGGSLEKIAARNEAGEIQWTHEYRREGSVLVQESHFGPDGTLEYTELYDYDMEDNLVEQARYTGGGIPQWRTVYDYDAQRRETTWTMYYSDGRIMKQGVEERNSQGDVVREVLRDEVEQTFQEVRLRYDGQGRVTERRTYNAEGVLQTVERLRYNEQNNVVEELVERFDGTLIRQKVNDYRYDDFGNWIEKSTVERERPEFGPVLVNETRRIRTFRY